MASSSTTPKTSPTTSTTPLTQPNPKFNSMLLELTKLVLEVQKSAIDGIQFAIQSPHGRPRLVRAGEKGSLPMALVHDMRDYILTHSTIQRQEIRAMVIKHMDRKLFHSLCETKSDNKSTNASTNASTNVSTSSLSPQTSKPQSEILPSGDKQNPDSNNSVSIDKKDELNELKKKRDTKRTFVKEMTLVVEQTLKSWLGRFQDDTYDHRYMIYSLESPPNIEKDNETMKQTPTQNTQKTENTQVWFVIELDAIQWQITHKKSQFPSNQEMLSALPPPKVFFLD